MEAKLTGKMILALVLLMSVQVFGQTSFYKVFSGNGYDKGEGACQLPNSSFLITGSSSSFEDAPSQAFLLRISNNGTFLWSKAYGGPESEEGKRVMAVPDYGYYIAGASSSSGSDDFDNYLVFTDTAGNQQWKVYTDNGGWERIHDAVLLPEDTSVFAVGETDANFSNTDIFLTRYTKTGGLMWSKQFGSDNKDIAYAAEIASDTSVLIAGTYYVADSLQNKAYLAMIHIADGSVIWEKTYGVMGNYQLNDVSLASGMIKAVGERIETGKTDHDPYTIATDMIGTTLWYEASYAEEDSRYGALVQYQPGASGKHFVASQVINPMWTYPEGEDVVISRFAGGLYWDGYGVSYSGIGQDQINQLIPTSDGFALAVGFHTTYGPGGNSVMIVKIGNDASFPPSTTNPTIINIVSTPELDLLKTLQVYPNPVNDQLFVDVPGEPFTYILTDAAGKQLLSGKAFGLETIEFTGQSAGMYFLKIIHTSGESATVKIVK